MQEEASIIASWLAVLARRTGPPYRQAPPADDNGRPCRSSSQDQPCRRPRHLGRNVRQKGHESGSGPAGGERMGVAFPGHRLFPSPSGGSCLVLSGFVPRSGFASPLVGFCLFGHSLAMPASWMVAVFDTVDVKNNPGPGYGMRQEETKTGIDRQTAPLLHARWRDHDDWAFRTTGLHPAIGPPPLPIAAPTARHAAGNADCSHAGLSLSWQACPL